MFCSQTDILFQRLLRSKANTANSQLDSSLVCVCASPHPSSPAKTMAAKVCDIAFNCFCGVVTKGHAPATHALALLASVFTVFASEKKKLTKLTQLTNTICARLCHCFAGSHCAHPRASDLRQPRQPDGRGRPLDCPW